jgi:hypothetical protein
LLLMTRREQASYSHGHSWHKTLASYEALFFNGKPQRSWPTWALDGMQASNLKQAEYSHGQQGR